MAEEQRALTISDAESISDAILKLVIAYPDYPSGFTATQANVIWNSTLKNTSIGLFPMSGAVYTKQYISGNYEAQFPFRIAYKANPQGNADMIKAQSIVEGLAKWLEEQTASFTDEHIKSIKIERTSVVYPFNTTETEQVFSCTLKANYFYKK